MMKTVFLVLCLLVYRIVMAVDLKWLIGALVCFVIVISVLIPTTITTGNAITPAGTATAELWTGTAGAAHAVAFKPVASVTAFKKAASYSQYNDTKINVGNATGNNHLHILIDSYAAHSSATWDNLTVTFTLQGVNATNNVTWVGGTCSPGGFNTTFITNSYTLVDADSTCITPGGVLTFNFVNKTAVEGADLTGSNVTNVTITYQRYVTSGAYTLESAAGAFTPTTSGHYYTSYTYGNQSGTSTQVLVLLLPLLIAAVLLVIFLRSSGLF